MEINDEIVLKFGFNGPFTGLSKLDPVEVKCKIKKIVDKKDLKLANLEQLELVNSAGNEFTVMLNVKQAEELEETGELKFTFEWSETLMAFIR